MDAIDDQLLQLQELFQNIVRTLKREKEELHVACHHFELVYTITLPLPCLNVFPMQQTRRSNEWQIVMHDRQTWSSWMWAEHVFMSPAVC